MGNTVSMVEYGWKKEGLSGAIAYGVDGLACDLGVKDDDEL